MPLERKEDARPIATLTAAADRIYGARRARDLGAQIKAVAAAIEAVHGYPVASGVAPWTGVPPIEPDERPEQV